MTIRGLEAEAVYLLTMKKLEKKYLKNYQDSFLSEEELAVLNKEIKRWIYDHYDEHSTQVEAPTDKEIEERVRVLKEQLEAHKKR